MKRVEAFDVNGVEIKRGSLVKIIADPTINHRWLKVGNTLRVSNWSDRTIGSAPFVCVFLESKGQGKLCQYGVQDKNLEVIEK